MNYQMNINLLAFEGAEVMEKDGERGVFLPIRHTFEGDKGAYLNMQAIEYKKMCRGYTHYMQKCTKSKEESEEQRQRRRDHTLPFYGTMKPLFYKKSEK